MPNRKMLLRSLSLKIDDYLCLPIHVYLKDRNGKYLECNFPQAQSFGSSISGIIGQTDDMFLNPKQAFSIRKNENEIIHQGTAKIIIETADFKNNPYQSWISIKSPLRSNGKIICVMGISFSYHDNSFPLDLSAFNLFNNKLPGTEDLSKNFGPFTPAIFISKREKECLHYLTQGFTTKKIAQLLHLSDRTIEFYIENMKKKFGCKKRTELLMKALHQSFATVPPKSFPETND